MSVAARSTLPPSTGRRLAWCAATLVLASLVVAAAPVGAAPASSTQLLVKFRRGTSPAIANREVERAGARPTGAIPQLDVRLLTAPGGRAAVVERRLAASPHVAFVDRDTTFEPQDVLPSDPAFPTSFSVAGGAWGWTKTRTTQAWEATRGDPSVVVAVLDTGLKTAGLGDFDGQVVAGWNVVAGTSDTAGAAGNHGTYVAAVIGLAGDNEQGNVGYCPGCRIMPVQIGSDSGATLSNMAKGIAWAVDHGARVLNLSWAGTTSSSTLASAVAYARGKGAVVVGAAGNSNCDCPTYPAATPGVLGVASAGPTDQKQADSNYGSWVALAAPSPNMTAWPSINGAPGYAPVGGTSLAAPVVSALAGLLLSAKPSSTAAEVEGALAASAVPVGFSVRHGRVDAVAALAAVGVAVPDPPGAPVNTLSPQVLVQTNGEYDYVALTRAPRPGDVLIRGQGSWRGSAPLSVASVRWERCNASGCVAAATAAKYTVQEVDAGYALRVVVAVRNGQGSTSASSPPTSAVGGGALGSAPQNTTLPAVTGTAQVGQTLSATDGTWSGSPTSYAYAWLRCDPFGAACSPVAGATSATYSPSDVDVGAAFRVVVTAANAAGTASATSAATAAVEAAPAGPAPSPPTQLTFTFSSSLNKKNPSRSFAVAGGQGQWAASLAFARCSSLELRLRGSDGAEIATASGPSAVRLVAAAGGQARYDVSGGQCSFTLTVTVPAT
jgi:subtilisin family serine protease